LRFVGCPKNGKTFFRKTEMRVLGTSAQTGGANGAFLAPDGAFLAPDGAFLAPDGAFLAPDGAFLAPDGAFRRLEILAARDI
jgi:hypothetical protein